MDQSTTFRDGYSTPKAAVMCWNKHNTNHAKNRRGTPQKKTYLWGGALDFSADDAGPLAADACDVWLLLALADGRDARDAAGPEGLLQRFNNAKKQKKRKRESNNHRITILHVYEYRRKYYWK